MFFQDRSGFRQFIRIQPSEPQFAGFQMHHDKDAEIMQKRREERRSEDICQRYLEILHHDERSCPEDRRRDLTARGGCGFNRTGEMRRIANPFHRGNGQ